MTEPTINPKPEAVRLLVVDDQRLMLDGIISLLSLEEEVTVIGTATSGKEAIAKATELKPDVILMDVRMPIMDGVTATTYIKRELPECKILMLTTFDDEEYVVDALVAGATGYLLKNIPEHDLTQAVIAAHKGIYQLDPAIAQKVVAVLAKNSNRVNPTLSRGQSATETTAFVGLTERELDVLRLIAQGLSNSEIARKLLISEGTVKNHISSILTRLKVRDRVQAAIYARENNLV